MTAELHNLPLTRRDEANLSPFHSESSVYLVRLNEQEAVFLAPIETCYLKLSRVQFAAVPGQKGPRAQDKTLKETFGRIA
jgi:hypothetical protein